MYNFYWSLWTSYAVNYIAYLTWNTQLIGTFSKFYLKYTTRSTSRVKPNSLSPCSLWNHTKGRIKIIFKATYFIQTCKHSLVIALHLQEAYINIKFKIGYYIKQKTATLCFTIARDRLATSAIMNQYNSIVVQPIIVNILVWSTNVQSSGNKSNRLLDLVTGKNERFLDFFQESFLVLKV